MEWKARMWPTFAAEVLSARASLRLGDEIGLAFRAERQRLGLSQRAYAAHRGWTLGTSAVLLVLMLVPLPTPGWPPRGWVLVACDVGQGDGLVLDAGDGAAVVVDTGPDPTLVDGCLRRLGVRRVPLVVLTHFHADHVGGLAGVLRGRRVGAR